MEKKEKWSRLTHIKLPHTYVIIFTMIVLAALLTHVVPAGSYDRYENANGTTVVDPTSFHAVEANPAGIMDVFEAIPAGLESTASLIFFVFIVGGAFQVINGTGAIVPRQGHYHIAKPLDRTYECRSEMCMHIEAAGTPVKYHHPEVGGAGQFEIEPMLGEMSKMADATMMIKYIIHNTAPKYGLSATLMPKPVYGEAGSGMHVHMLLLKDGKPVFSDDEGYAHLSREAHYFMGGLLKHIHSLCAITNPSTNSFKRLVPGFEAPVTVGYATSNRSAVIRIPAYAKTPELRRFELRNPDATCNPYFCYAALLMAGLDGIENQIDPHENGWGPYDVNLYTLPEEEKAKLQGLPTTLEAALDALEKDHDYLTKGGVFPEALIRNFIAGKRKECAEMAKIPHPAEFAHYYNL